MAVGGARRCRLSLRRLWRAWHCSRSCRRVATGPGCALGHSCGPWQATERERSGRCRTLRRKLARHLHDKVGTDVGPRKRCSASGLAESPSFVRTVGCTLGRPVTGREPTRTLLLLLRRCVCCICHPSTPVYSVCCCHCHTATAQANPHPGPHFAPTYALPNVPAPLRPLRPLQPSACTCLPALTTLASVSLPVCAVRCRHPCYTFSPCNRRTNTSLPVHIARVPAHKQSLDLASHSPMT